MSEGSASARVRDEWLRRIEAEYRSSAVTQELTLWLIQIGASPDLIRDGLRIADDELAHAELCQEVYRDAGGRAAPRIDRETLGLSRQSRILEQDVLRAGVRVFCLGETVAVPLFGHLRSGCTVDSAKRALDRVLRDEVRHRDFGWDLLYWLVDGPSGGDLRSLVDVELPGMFFELERDYGSAELDGCGADAKAQAAMAPEDRAWGLAPGRDYARILAETVERAYVPRFAEAGIDARAAWARRRDAC